MKLRKLYQLLGLIVIFFIFFFMITKEDGILSFFDDYFGDHFSVEETTLSDDYSLKGEAAILVDADRGAVLFAKNENKKMYPASTTKILTALVALEHGDLDEKILVGNEIHMREKGESISFIQEGQVLTLRQLIAGMLLPSGNDAARTIAVHIAKKTSGQDLTNDKAIEFFTKLMNQKAKEIGAKHSHFVNPHGLHDPNHYTTAYDMAIIAKEAMNNQALIEIFSKNKYTDPTITFPNRNQLVDPTSKYYYQGANGIKTGYTEEAGYCLVSSAIRDGKTLIAVVLKSTETGVWKDSIALLNSGFTSLTVKK